MPEGLGDAEVRVHRDVGNTDCDECVLQRDEFKPHGILVQIGSGDETALVCLPCLKRAVAEAEAAVARDKG